MRTVFLLGLLLCGFVDTAEAACSVPRWRFIWDVETNAYINSDGGRCRLQLVWTSGKTEVSSVGIAAQPHDGTVSVSGHNVFYTP